MPDAFEDRKNTFEKQFVNDETMRFRATARRNKALAGWAAELKGLKGEAVGRYVEDFIGAQTGRSDDDVAAALKADLVGADLSDHRLRKKMSDEMTAALASVKASK